jgi:oligopeptidase B
VDDPVAFDVIGGYSPYENVAPVPYPAILATAGVTDPRVSVHEPTKWVQQLRATSTGDRPILLKVEMGAGHGGPTGRYDAWRDEAFVLAFALRHVAT